VKCFLNISFLAIPTKYLTMPSHLGAVTSIEYECCPDLSSCSPDICTDLLVVALACTCFEARLPVRAVCALPSTVGLCPRAGIF